MSRRSDTSGLRVALDATPLLGQPTGIGRYTAELLSALTRLPAGERPAELLGAAFTWRGREALPARLPAGVTAVGRRAPARLLREAWQRTEFPSLPMLGARADVVHGTNFVLPPPGRGVGGVVTVHDLSYLRYPDTVSTASARYRELVPKSLRRAALVVTDTQAVADEVVEEYRLPADRVRAIPLGVDPAWFDAPVGPPPGLGLPERYLLFVGTLEPRKDVATLLDAFRRLRRTDPQTPPLVLAGPSGWGPALDTAGLTAADVVQLGYVDSATLRAVVAHAAALCFPSLYEGFGLPPLEALAAGTPVIASDIAPLREVLNLVTESVKLVPVRDAEALSYAIMQTLAAPPDPAPGRAHARLFTWDKTAVMTAQAYRDSVD
ncbi:MAG TPA: glycosyltransferase family 1 protein [Frankiaceae bacterium]|nr:glycosyltransferase family 1 protein [Frankiaceae bacterium]